MPHVDGRDANSSSNGNSTASTTPRIGINGVRLKKFEQVCADILPHKSCVPSYLPLPKPPTQYHQHLISSTVAENPIFRAKVEYEDKNGGETGDIPPPEWPFSALPLDAGVRESKTHQNIETFGKLPGMRAVKKEWQLKSLIQCVLAMLPTSALGPPRPVCDETGETNTDYCEKNNRRIKIVDFAGGTGHLALPLAVLLPKVDVVLVDLKAASLELAHEKAKELCTPATPCKPNNVEVEEGTQNSDQADPANTHNGKKAKKKKGKRRPKLPSAYTSVDVTSHANVLRQSKHLSNLYTYHGSISSFADQYDDFDIGLALHACGEATDLVLRACGQAHAANFIVSPCCVGKLNTTRKNPYIYAASSGNVPTVTYPQSSAFCSVISSKEEFDYLAKAADYSEMKDMRTPRNATRRTAKALLEMDRLLYMKETYGYSDIVLTRMEPWEASPKNDILIGWVNLDTNSKRNDSSARHRSVGCPYGLSGGDEGLGGMIPCVDANADIHTSMRQLVIPTDGQNPDESQVSSGSTLARDDGRENEIQVDWTKEEHDEIEAHLLEFIQCDETVREFPLRMGKRKRKLVHYLAEKMHLRHWSEGKKYGDKTVCVGKPKIS